jgi:hypothetical protein
MISMGLFVFMIELIIYYVGGAGGVPALIVYIVAGQHKGSGILDDDLRATVTN